MPFSANSASPRETASVLIEPVRYSDRLTKKRGTLAEARRYA
jgi:hypothetical protein